MGPAGQLVKREREKWNVGMLVNRNNGTGDSMEYWDIDTDNCGFVMIYADKILTYQ